MRKLDRYANKSQLMDIRIKLGEELFKFNLFEELVVNENIINDELKAQPTISGFLGSLHTKLDRIKEDKEAEMDKVYHELFVKYKRQKNDLGRPNSDDMTKSLAISHKKYQKAACEYRTAKENATLIKVSLQAFEQRSYLIQTLSANLRKNN